MYSEYEIRASLIKAFKQALIDMQVPGYIVIAGNQQTMTHARDCVIIDKTYMRQHGWQSYRIMKIKQPDGSVLSFKRQDWIEEWTWQISVAHLRKVEDVKSTMTGEDVANRLRVWLNSADGAATMRSMPEVPFAPMQTFDVKLRSYKDDSDISQIEATFDFKMQVVQFRDTEPKKIEDWELEIHRI